MPVIDLPAATGAPVPLDLRHNGHLLLIGPRPVRAAASRAIRAQLTQLGFITDAGAALDLTAELELRDALMRELDVRTLQGRSSVPPIALALQEFELRTEHRQILQRGRAAAIHLLVGADAVAEVPAPLRPAAVALLRAPSAGERVLLDIPAGIDGACLVTPGQTRPIGAFA